MCFARDCLRRLIVFLIIKGDIGVTSRDRRWRRLFARQSEISAYYAAAQRHYRVEWERYWRPISTELWYCEIRGWLDQICHPHPSAVEERTSPSHYRSSFRRPSPPASLRAAVSPLRSLGTMRRSDRLLSVGWGKTFRITVHCVRGPFAVVPQLYTAAILLVYPTSGRRPAYEKVEKRWGEWWTIWGEFGWDRGRRSVH